MAINLPLIAQTYYNGQSVSIPEPLTSDFMTGWGAPYNTWPADSQAQYAYNPIQAKALLLPPVMLTVLLLTLWRIRLRI